MILWSVPAISIFWKSLRMIGFHSKQNDHVDHSFVQLNEATSHDM